MKRIFTLLAALLLTCGFSWAQTRTQVTDHMTAEDLAAIGTAYTDFSNVTLNSDAVYAGQSAKNNAGAIQLRSKNSNSGIITTASGGTISSITITVESGTNTIDVYGKNTAYTSASDLYATSGSQNNQGTKIGSLTETGTITVTDDYAYVGIRSNNGAVYIESIDFVWETGGSENDPSITADNVEIAYNATSGSISYTINNPANNGQMSASTTADWLTPGTATGSAVAFTCTANTTPSSRTATVTLTYTYNTDQTTTKNIQVTQAANPNVVNTISEITAAGTYAVQGTIVAMSQRGLIVGDGTGYVYYFVGSDFSTNYGIGDMIKLSGAVKVYGSVFEFDNTATVTEASDSNYEEEDPTVLTGADMDARVTSNAPMLSNYVQYEGTLSVSGTHYNITDITGATTAIGSISFPLDADEVEALNGKHVTVKGYYVGISTGTYYNTMLGSIEESVNVNPTITAEDVEIAYNSTSGSIAFTVNNPANDGVLSASTESEWLTLGTVGSTVPFTCEANNTASPRTATVTLTYTYNTDQFITKSVTVTQAGNPNTIDNISDITAAGTYTVQGTIVAMSQRGLIVGDGTGYVYYYGGQNFSTNYGIGDMIKLSGDVQAYGGVLEFTSTATVTESENSNYEDEEPTVLTGADMDARVASTTPAQLSNYVQYEGTLSVSGTHYNITDIAGATTAQGSISYPLDTDEITALNGKLVRVSGYFVGISSSTYYNTMIGSIEEVVVPVEGYTLTVSNLTHVNTYVFAGDEAAAALEGEGSIQVNNGTTVMVSLDVEEGYVIESLMVDGTDVTDQLDDSDAYTFFMPTHDVTITATAVEYVPPVPTTYRLATTIESGKSYIIVGKTTIEGEDLYYAMGEQRTNNRGGVAINVEDDMATVEGTAVKEVVITALDEDGFYSIYDAEIPGYLYAASNNANQLKTKAELDENGKWEITIDTVFHIVASNSTNRNVMQFNYSSNNPLFSCYASASQKPVYLFVKEEASEAQTIELAAGWNWVSFNKEITMADLQAAIVAANPGAQPVIKSQTAGQTSYNGAIWLGALKNLDLTQMYEIKVANACTITLNGDAIDAANFEITIKPGINWIAYPLNTTMPVATAFNGFSTTLDVVKSRNDGQANFMGTIWTGALKTLNPGEGYIYNSKATGNKTLTFPTR
ncbi:MAG: BACON domain-containing protein [Bacteroidales bacterium]|nr:BACON domain-containing protein [Bacteroidales bacterium]